MKRPQGHRRIACPHGNKITIWFRTLHRMKMEAEYPPCCLEDLESGTYKIITEEEAMEDVVDMEAEEGDYRG